MHLTCGLLKIQIYFFSNHTLLTTGRVHGLKVARVLIQVAMARARRHNLNSQVYMSIKT